MSADTDTSTPPQTGPTEQAALAAAVAARRNALNVKRGPLLRELVPFMILFYLSPLVLLLPHAGAAVNVAGMLISMLACTLWFVVVGVVPWQRLPLWCDPIGPIVFLGLLSFLRFYTGERSSPLTALVLLPGIWLALRGTTAHFVAGLAATLAVFIVPVWVFPDAQYPNTEISRGIMWCSVVAIAGITIQAIVRNGRSYINQTESLTASNAELSSGMANDQLRLSVMLDSVDVGIIACDRDGKVTLTNGPALQMVADTRGVDVGSPELDAVLDRVGLDGQVLPEALQGEVVKHREHRVVFPRTGEERWLLLTGGPILDENREINGAVLAITDVTNRVLAEQEVADARDRIERLLDAVTDQGVIGTDADGVITLLNPGAQALLGVDPDEVIDRLTLWTWHDPDELAARATDLDLPADADLGQAVIAPAMSGRGETRLWTLVRPDGRRMDASMNVTALREEDGTLTGFLAIVADITAQRAAEKLKDQFVATVSHELRTPLSSIIGYLELLLDDPAAEEFSPAQARYLGIIDRNSRRLLRLVGDLLFAAQVGSGSVTVRRAPADLPAILEQAVESAGPKARAAQIDLELSIEADLTEVNVDSDRVGQAVDNIIGNAVKFTPTGGRIIVRLRADESGAAVIDVADTGPGIPEEEQKGIFEAFVRARSADEQAVPGVGLGLAISRAIASAHDGQLQLVESSPAGTTFRILLPA